MADLCFEYGDYEVDLSTRLGGGTYGVVYKGKDTRNMMDIAVKHFTNCSIEFAKKEVDGLCGVGNHDHIVKFIDSFVSDGCLWIVMKLSEGPSLDVFMEQQNPALSIKMELITQLVDTVTYIHGLNPPVVHRNLKPSNVIVVSGRSIQLCSFLASKIITEDGPFNATTFCGTTRYMAPELFNFQRYNAQKVDMFALGLVMLGVSVFEPGKRLSKFFTPEGASSLGQEMHRLQSEHKPIDSLKKKLMRVCISRPDISQLVTIISQIVVFCPEERLDAAEVQRFVHAMQPVEEEEQEASFYTSAMSSLTESSNEGT